MSIDDVFLCWPNDGVACRKSGNRFNHRYQFSPFAIKRQHPDPLPTGYLLGGGTPTFMGKFRFVAWMIQPKRVGMPAGRLAVQQSEKAIPVGLAETNPLMLGALSEVFDRDPRFSLVFTVRSAEGFLEVALRTDVAVGVIDWGLPSLGGRRLLEIVRAQEQVPRIVVYGEDGERDIARGAMAAGAAGFCSRTEPPERLLEIVAEVAKGQMVFPFLDVRALASDPIDTLTDRERHLLERLATGLSNKALAEDLGVSINTIKFHLRNLYEKLSVSSRTQAIARYFSRDDRLSNHPRPAEDDHRD